MNESFLDSFWYEPLKFLLNVLLLSSVAATAVIPTFFNDKMLKSQRRTKKLTPVGVCFLVCVAVSVGLGYFISFLDGKESERFYENALAKELNYRDSISSVKLSYKDSLNEVRSRNTALESRMQVKQIQDSVTGVRSLLTEKSFQYENLSLKLEAEHKENVLLQSELNSPVLYYSPSLDGINPLISYDTAKGRYSLAVNVKNSGKGKAMDITYRFLQMRYENNDFKVVGGSSGDYSNATNILNEGAVNSYISFLEQKDLDERGQCIIALEVQCKNAFKQSRPPLRKIFLFDKEYVGKNLPLLKNQEVEFLENFLVQRKFWK